MNSHFFPVMCVKGDGLEYSFMSWSHLHMRQFLRKYRMGRRCPVVVRGSKFHLRDAVSR